MPEGTAGGGCKVTGAAEFRNGICEKCHIPMDVEEETDTYLCPKCGGHVGELLVRFKSEDAEDYWGERYQAERIKYCMRHRRDKIPMYLRTGKKPLFLRIGGLEREAKRLEKLNQLEKVETK